MNDLNSISVVEEKSPKKRKIDAPPKRNLSVRFSGYPLFLLLELIPHIPQLDDASLLRSVYDADTSAVERGWGDWFCKVVAMDRNEDRCTIVEAVFRIFPNLVTKKFFMGYEENKLLPLVALLYKWPAGATLPTSLLDQIKAATKDNPAFFRISRINCGNKNEVAMWCLRHLRIQHPSYCLRLLIENFFSVQAVLAHAEVLKPERSYELTFSDALETALRSGGQYWDERLLRFLWKRTNYVIFLGLDLPDWFRSLVASKARKRPEIRMLSRDGRSDEMLAKFAVPMVREMQSNSTLSKWTLHCNHGYDGMVNAVHDVLCQCSSLREFTFTSNGRRRIKIPVMPNLEKLNLEDCIFFPESLEPMMQTARQISLSGCELQFPPEATTTVPPDCFEGWTKGLSQNGCIEQLIIVDQFATGSFRVCGRAFIEVLASRPSLKVLELYFPESAEEERGFDLDLRPEDMRKLGLMESLESLDLRKFPPNALKSLLGANPVRLQEFSGADDMVLTKCDYLEYLKFLSHPKCKLEKASAGRIRFSFSPSSAYEDDDGEEEGDDERLRFPVRSFLDVLRDHNCTLRETRNFEISTPKEKAELRFWCGMNRTCPNRLELRRELSVSYADQIAEYMSGGSHSEVFELIRTTFHLWGC